MIVDEMVGWHHRLNVHEFEQAPGVGDGLGNLACYGHWGHKVLETTERLNWSDVKFVVVITETKPENTIKRFHYITGRINENVVTCPLKATEYVLELLKQK